MRSPTGTERGRGRTDFAGACAGSGLDEIGQLVPGKNEVYDPMT
ncbi:hypothetical protein ACWEWD_39830 [Streptomyces tendae]